MINQYIESVEIQKENDTLKVQNEVLKTQLEALQTRINELLQENERLADTEYDAEYCEDSIKYNFEGLIEYLSDNHMLTNEIKNLIEFYSKFYIEV